MKIKNPVDPVEIEKWKKKILLIKSLVQQITYSIPSALAFLKTHLGAGLHSLQGHDNPRKKMPHAKALRR